jgi:hypothetical protein
MRIRKNETVAGARTMFVVVYDLDGAPAAPEAVPASMLYYDNGSGAMVAATGTWAPRTKPLVVADFTFTMDSGTDLVTRVAHGLRTGDGPIFPTTSGSFAGTGVTASNPYYAVKIDADTFKIATTRANALAGTTVDILAAGSGTHTFADSAATERCWRGQFLYTFTQAETNVSARYVSITVDDDETTIRKAEQTADVFEHEMDRDANVGGATYGDLERGAIAILGGPVLDYTSNTYVFKDPWTLVVRWTGTVGPTGRLSIIPGTLT